MQFAYSPDRLPLEQTVQWSFQEKPTSNQMKDFWSKYGIQQQQIDNLYILTVDQQWVATPKQMPELQQTIEFHQPEPRETYQMTSLDRRPLPVFLSLKNPRIQAEPQQMNAVNIQPDKYQVTFMPGLSSAGPRPQTTAYHVSFNMLWGQTGLVDGLEVGGLINEVTWDVKGFQMAGLINQVGETMEGVQVSGGINVTYGAVWGAQMASIANVTGEMHGFQVAGLVNIAGEVKGVQIGLLNVADTVGGASIGLLSLVNRGYNRIEIAAGDALWANLGLKLGTRRFYNIFHGGLRWYDASVAGDEELTWGVGYGFGTAARLSPRTLLNLELLAIHVNERSRWTHELNLLNQFRMTLDFRLGRTLSLFAGGTFNVMVSRLLDPDTGEIGSGIAPYHWSNYTTNGTNVQTWAGFNAGLRF